MPCGKTALVDVESLNPLYRVKDVLVSEIPPGGDYVILVGEGIAEECLLDKRVEHFRFRHLGQEVTMPAPLHTSCFFLVEDNRFLLVSPLMPIQFWTGIWHEES